MDKNESALASPGRCGSRNETSSKVHISRPRFGLWLLPGNGDIMFDTANVCCDRPGCGNGSHLHTAQSRQHDQSLVRSPSLRAVMRSLHKDARCNDHVRGYSKSNDGMRSIWSALEESSLHCQYQERKGKYLAKEMETTSRSLSFLTSI